MLPEHLRYLPPHREHRVQRGECVLEDHRDPVAPDLAALLLLHLEQVLAPEEDLTAGHEPRRRVDDPHDRLGAHGLPGARLADDGEGLPLVDLIAHLVGRLHRAGSHPEFDLEVTHLEEHTGTGRVGSNAVSSGVTLVISAWDPMRRGVRHPSG